MKRLLLSLTLLALLFSSGCAAIPRNTTLVDPQTGETLEGGFNLVTKNGWVMMPDGTKLTGKIVGVNDSERSFHSFRGRQQTYGFRPEQSRFSIRGQSYKAPSRGEGWAILRSPDGKQVMEISVVSNGPATSGYGEGVMNDGRRYVITW